LTGVDRWIRELAAACCTESPRLDLPDGRLAGAGSDAGLSGAGVAAPILGSECVEDDHVVNAPDVRADGLIVMSGVQPRIVGSVRPALILAKVAGS
jgi:hypothetical protein